MEIEDDEKIEVVPEVKNSPIKKVEEEKKRRSTRGKVGHVILNHL